MASSAIKLMLFVRRKQGMTPAEFENYYENNHAPLVESLFASVHQRVTRNYIQRQGAIEGRPGGIEELMFDAVTEIWFETEAKFLECQRRLADPEIQKVLSADEKKFIDHHAFYVVKEKIGKVSQNTG